MWLNYSSVKITMATNHLYVIAAPINHRVLTVGRALCSKLLKWVNSRLVEHACMPCFSLVQLFENPMDCSPTRLLCPWNFLSRILEWVAISYSRGSSWPRDQTHISCLSKQILYPWATWKSQNACTNLTNGETETIGFKRLVQNHTASKWQSQNWNPTHVCVHSTLYMHVCTQAFFSPMGAGYTIFLVLKLLFTS